MEYIKPVLKFVIFSISSFVTYVTEKIFFSSLQKNKSIKFGIIVVFLGALTLTSYSQTTYYWRAVSGSDDWNSATNWSTTGPAGGPAATVPGTLNTDIAIFDGITGGVVITVNSNYIIGKLQVVNNSDIILSPPNPGSRVLTLNTNTTDAFVISSNSTLDLLGQNGNKDITLTFSAGVNVGQTISGYFRLSPDGSGVGIFDRNNAPITFDATSTYEHAVNGYTVPTATWSVTSNCFVTGVVGSVPGNINQAFGNFTWDCPSQTTANGSLDGLGNGGSVAGDFNLVSTGTGGLRLADWADRTLSIGGSFNISGGRLNMVINSNPNRAGTINLAGNFNMTGGTLSESNTDPSSYGAIVFNGVLPQTFTKSGAAVISNTINFTVNSGSIVDMGSSVLDGSNGTFTLSSGGTIITAHAQGLASGGATGSVQSTGTRSFDSGASYTYNGIAAQITGTGLPLAVNNLTINNAAGVTLTNTGNLTISTDLLLTNGVFSIGNTNINSGGTSVCGTGSISATGGTFSLTGVGNTNLPGGSFINLTVNRTGGAVVSVCGPVDISGVFDLTAGLISLGTNNLTLGLAASVGGTPGATAMVVTNGSGQFIKSFATGDTPSFTFPVGDNSGTAEYSPLTTDFSANAVSGNVGVIVTDAMHPSTSSSDFISRYWTYSTTGLTTYTYTTSTYQYIPTASDVVGSEALMKLNYWDGSTWTNIANSSAAGGLLSISASLNESTGPLNGNAYTARNNTDITPPTVSSVSSTAIDGTYKTGDVIAITVLFNENVVVTGTPQITLETGTTDQVVNYTGGTGTNTLTFDYTVQAGDVSADLDYTATTSLALSGGTIKDIAGNDATLTLAAPGAANSLGSNKNIVIDGVAPVVSLVSSTAIDGTYKTGDVIAVTVLFNENVVVTGTPQITLETGTTDQVVNYTGGTGTNTLTFDYTVQAGDVSPDLDYTATTSLALSGGTIKDIAGNDATLTLAAPGAANSLGSNKNIVIDGVAPVVSTVSSTAIDGTYKTGDVIAITVLFNENVVVTGTPQITLETGTTDQVVNYTGGTGTNTLTFDYTVQAGDVSADLDYTATTSLALSGGTIKDIAGNDATLTLAAPGAANSLGSNKNIVIDGVAPVVSLVSSTAIDGTYKTGDVIAVTVLFNENVVVTGTPQITLETGTTDQVVNYTGGTGTNTLSFNYTVQAGDISA